jgi:hypothetical protein
MLIKRLFLFCSISTLLTGCAEFFGSQPPAPVYGNNTPVYGNKPVPQKQPKATETTQSNQQPSTETVTTAPLKGMESIGTVKELKPEVLPSGQSLLTPAQEQELSALQQPVLPEIEPETKPEPKPKTEPKTPVVEQPPEPVITPPQPVSTTFQPLENFKSTSPAVSSLVMAANEDSQKGNVESATMTLERASSIEPRNAALYYKLALLKLKSKPAQAEDLAKKSAQLAANDPSLKKHSWLLVAKARELQKDFQGAQEARDKASKF